MGHATAAAAAPAAPAADTKCRAINLRKLRVYQLQSWARGLMSDNVKSIRVLISATSDHIFVQRSPWYVAAMWYIRYDDQQTPQACLLSSLPQRT